MRNTNSLLRQALTHPSLLSTDKVVLGKRIFILLQLTLLPDVLSCFDVSGTALSALPLFPDSLLCHLRGLLVLCLSLGCWCIPGLHPRRSPLTHGLLNDHIHGPDFSDHLCFGNPRFVLSSAIISSLLQTNLLVHHTP